MSSLPSPTNTPLRFAISPLRRDQAVDYALAHVELLNTTYAHLVDAGYASRRRAEHAERVAELLADIDEAEAADAAGRPAFRRHLIAHNARGSIVGVAAAGDGLGAWEEPHLGVDWDAPAITFCLDHLYVVPGAHGSGLGQALLDAALPGRRDAFLWVFAGNPRAIRFYERNGFASDGTLTDTGDSWGSVPMRRLVRLGAAA